jgi:hypothetical protein
MTEAERVQAIVSEFSSDYLIVLTTRGESVVIMSDPDYANDAYKLLPEAIQRGKEDARRDDRGNHETKQDAPGGPQASGKEPEADAE